MRKRIITFLLLLVFCVSGLLFTACGDNKGGSGAKDEVDDRVHDAVDNMIDAEFSKAFKNCSYSAKTDRSGSHFSVPANGYDGSHVELMFYHTMGKSLFAIFEEELAEFNKKYPNIKITCQKQGSYDDVRKMITQELPKNNHPNIAFCYPDHIAQYNLSSRVIILDDLIKSKVPLGDGIVGFTKEQEEDFIPGYYDEGRRFADGNMYSLPFSKSTEVLFYNKDFFDANKDKGLKVPTTWDEMEEACKKIKEIDPDSIPLGYDSEANWFITMCEQLDSEYTTAHGKGGEHFLFNNVQNKKFVRRIREWYQKGYVTTQALNGNKYTSTLLNSTDKVKAYMCIGSTGGTQYQKPSMDDAGNYRFSVGITSIPQINPEKPRVISQGPNLCIFNKAEKMNAMTDKETQEILASWLFVKHFTTSQVFQAKYSMQSGYVPVIQTAINHPVYQDHLAKANGKEGLTALSAKVCVEQTQAYYTSDAFNGSAKARDEVGSLLIACMSKAV